jgi:hypothetical protein
MAFFLTRDDQQIPLPAASNIAPRSFVKLVGSNAAQVLQVAAVTDEPYGYTAEATAVQGEANAIFLENNVVKAIAAASIGVGALVGLASIGVASAAQRNAIATVTLLGPVTVASGTKVWTYGRSLTPAAAGEVFSVHVKFRITGQANDQ